MCTFCWPATIATLACYRNKIVFYSYFTYSIVDYEHLGDNSIDDYEYMGANSINGYGHLGANSICLFFIIFHNNFDCSCFQDAESCQARVRELELEPFQPFLSLRIFCDRIKTMIYIIFVYLLILNIPSFFLCTCILYLFISQSQLYCQCCNMYRKHRRLKLRYSQTLGTKVRFISLFSGIIMRDNALG